MTSSPDWPVPSNYMPEWPVIASRAGVVSRKVAREFPGIEVSDIEQEIYLWVAQNRGTLERRAYSTRMLTEAFTGVARKYAGRERHAFIHYSSEWIYTPGEVRAVLQEAFFDRDVWLCPPQKDDGVSISAKNIVVCLWDMDRAYAALPIEDQTVIAMRFDKGLTLNDAERKRMDRAIDRITLHLNGHLAARRSTGTVTTADI